MRAPPTEPPITEAELLEEVVEVVEVESVVEVVGMPVRQCMYDSNSKLAVLMRQYADTS